MTRTVEVEAPAKVNLFLRVLDRRSDGFHELDTLFQALSLSDRVQLSMADATADEVAPVEAARQREPSGADAYVREAPPPIQLTVDGQDLGPVASNLAYRAARRFLEVQGSTAPVRIRLEKRIPAGAGLGGGSSDAAAVLKAMAALTEFEDAAALHEMACALGSDVPFFLAGSPLARGRGRGERLTELPPLPEGHLVLALPDVHVSTAEAYAALAKAREGSEASFSAGPDAAVEMPATWTDVEALAHNDFEPVVAPRHEAIRESLEALRRAGASVTLLSGSGAASFGLFPDEQAAAEAARKLEARHPWRFVPVTTRTSVPRILTSSE